MKKWQRTLQLSRRYHSRLSKGAPGYIWGWLLLIGLIVSLNACAGTSESPKILPTPTFISGGNAQVTHVAAGPGGTACLTGSASPVGDAPVPYLRCFGMDGTAVFFTPTDTLSAPARTLRVDAEGNSYVLTVPARNGVASHLYLNKYRFDGILAWSQLVAVESNLALFDLDPQGRPVLYIEDASGEYPKLIRYSADGQRLSQHSVMLGAYWALEISDRGNLYALDLPYEGADAICVNKYRADGQALWSGLCAEELQGEMGLATTTGDAVYVVASTAGGRAGVALYKLDRHGKTLWRRVLAPAHAELAFRAVAADKAGNVYLTGTVRRRPDLVAQIPVADDQNVFVRKYGPSGRFLWNRHHGTPDRREEASGLDVQEEDVVFVGGVSEELTTGVSGPEIRDAFLLKLGERGYLTWAR